MPAASAFDCVVIGGGILGLAAARELISRKPGARIFLIEKEADVARHASGRNSGVLHAGFYYTADSLKARFTREGNRRLREHCREKRLPLNECGKIVVAREASDLPGLEELKRRGDRNGVELHWLDPGGVEKIDPNAKTHERALWSPTTATLDPARVCLTLRRELEAAGVDVRTGTAYLGRRNHTLHTTRGPIEFGCVINCAGLYADRIARDFGFGKNLTILPFKGTYLIYRGHKRPVKTNVYPVPNLGNPFLGVHFTLTADGTVKIGPTATPAFWRENYEGFAGLKLRELVPIGLREARLFLANASCWPGRSSKSTAKSILSP